MKATSTPQIADTDRLLLHSCCAPCVAGCVERLIDAYGSFTIFYSNSNIATLEEFNLRLAQLQKLANEFDLPLIVDPYDHESWLQSTASLSSEPEGGKRCLRCFEFSLTRTATVAKEQGFTVFATSLTVSPRKSSEAIFQIGRQWSNFREWNFKKQGGYQRGVALSNELELYRQRFCGCEFSC